MSHDDLPLDCDVEVDDGPASAAAAGPTLAGVAPVVLWAQPVGT